VGADIANSKEPPESARGQGKPVEARPTGLLTRRKALGLGLAAAGASFLGRGCSNGGDGGGPPKPPGPSPVYELTDGHALYDDFEGNGNHQTFDGKNLALPGALGPKIWSPAAGAHVVESPAMDPESPLAQHYLEISTSDTGAESAWLTNPPVLAFADFRSLSVDMCLAADPSTVAPSAVMMFHTTIPEQPPGHSWYVRVGITRDLSESVFMLGEYGNVNLGIIVGDSLGPAMLDEWHNLRLDILTRRDDPTLGETELRLAYYVDGVLKASRIPEDSAILIDPTRTGLGPSRSLIVAGQKGTGVSIGRFDNVRCVYRDRIA
jgi:hypothetical protein